MNKLLNYLYYYFYCLVNMRYLNNSIKHIIKEILVNPQNFYVTSYNKTQENERFIIKNKNLPKMCFDLEHTIQPNIFYSEDQFTLKNEIISSESNYLISDLLYNHVCISYIRELEIETRKYKDYKFKENNGL